MAAPGEGMDVEMVCETSSVEQLKGPVSSLVKLFFRTPKQNSEKRGEFADNVRAAAVVIQRKLECLEAEILRFKEDNRRLEIMMKENAKHTSRLMLEKAAWELQKNSETAAFQQYKEAEINKLQKERCKLEQQTRVLTQFPKKEERKENEELRAKLAEERAANLKIELQWRQRSSRLYGVNKNLKDQILELRKEIGRHEDRLLLELKPGASDNVRNVQSWSRIKSIDSGGTAQEPRVTIGTIGKAWKEKRVGAPDVLHFTNDKYDLKRPPHARKVQGDILDKSGNCDAKHPREVKDRLRDARGTFAGGGGCADATIILEQKLKHLEEEVEEWINVHT